MAKQWLLAFALFLSVGSRMLLAADPAPYSSQDQRLQRAVTLDDYHPWVPVTDRDAWRARATRVREQILVAAGLWPMPPPAPLNSVVHGKIDRDEYTVEKVFFQSYPGFYVTGNLYRPKKTAEGLRPAVLCPHGHWQNGRFFERSESDAKKEMEKGWEKTLDGARYPLQARCAMLARMGCVVFHYDMVGYADSRQIEHGKGFRDADAELRLQSAFGLQTYNSVRAFDFLSSLPDVDLKRIGVTGASGGGTQTFILCAIDGRPAVAFPAVMVSTSMQGGCVCENATLLRVNTGNIEFAALTAPRPLGMTGANDWTLEIETKGLPELKALYTALRVPDLVDAKCFPTFEHNYNQVSRERMYNWMSRHLQLGWTEPVEEKPFEPISPKDLSVFDDAHPRPADAVDAAQLRRYMSETSDRQMAALLPRDGPGLAEFRRIVGGALRAIINSEVPALERLTVKKLDLWEGKECRSEKLVLGRAGTGDEVQATWLVPGSWKGTVVVTVHGEGRAALLDGPGDPREPLRPLLSRGAAVLVPDVFLTGRAGSEGTQRAFPVDAKRHQEYCGYTFGYNRTPLANRVHDVLTLIGYARSVPGTHTVHLWGLGEGGLCVLLAKGLAGDAVLRTMAEGPDFDFQDVKDVNDLRFLPGGVKYGGWGAFAALCAPGELSVLGDSELPEVLLAAYRAGGVEKRIRRLSRTRGWEAELEKLLE